MIVNNKIFFVYHKCNEEISMVFSLVGTSLMTYKTVNTTKQQKNPYREADSRECYTFCRNTGSIFSISCCSHLVCHSALVL